MATFNTGCGTLHVKNASPVDVGFSIAQAGNVQYVVQAGEPRNIPVVGSKNTIYWSQQTVLNNNGNQQQSVVYVESYESTDTIPDSQSTSPNINTGNFVGNQQSYQTFGFSHAFFNTGGSAIVNIITPPAGKSVYIGAVDCLAFENSVNANVPGLQWSVHNLDAGFSSVGWICDLNAGVTNWTPGHIAFPGPLKCQTGVTPTAEVDMGSAGTSGGLLMSMNIYYFVQ